MAGSPGLGGGAAVHSSWLGTLGCRTGPATCKAEIPDIGNREWSYVGERRGAYKVVEQIVWVGEGNGSVNVESRQPRQPITSPQKECNRWKAKCCMIFYQGILCMIVVCLVLGTVFAVPSVAGMLTSAWTSIGCSSTSKMQKHDNSVFQKDSSEGDVIMASYDCQIGILDWEKKWSPDKQEFCCQYGGFGCSLKNQTTSSVTSTSSLTATPFASPAASSETILHTTLQETVAFVQTPAQVPDQRSTPAAPQVGPTVSTDVPTTGLQVKLTPASPSAPGSFDCKIGYDHWETVWTIAKKFWCCEYGSRCPIRKQ